MIVNLLTTPIGWMAVIVAPTDRPKWVCYHRVIKGFWWRFVLSLS